MSLLLVISRKEVLRMLDGGGRICAVSGMPVWRRPGNLYIHT